jgi:hypothetical protein
MRNLIARAAGHRKPAGGCAPLSRRGGSAPFNLFPPLFFYKFFSALAARVEDREPPLPLSPNAKKALTAIRTRAWRLGALADEAQCAAARDVVSLDVVRLDAPVTPRKEGERGAA